MRITLSTVRWRLYRPARVSVFWLAIFQMSATIVVWMMFMTILFPSLREKLASSSLSLVPHPFIMFFVMLAAIGAIDILSQCVLRTLGRIRLKTLRFLAFSCIFGAMLIYFVQATQTKNTDLSLVEFASLPFTYPEFDLLERISRIAFAVLAALLGGFGITMHMIHMPKRAETGGEKRYQTRTP